MLSAGTGLPLPLKPAGQASKKAACIVIKKDPALAARGEEAYSIQSSPNGIILSAADARGIFYAGQSLVQMMPWDLANTILLGTEYIGNWSTTDNTLKFVVAQVTSLTWTGGGDNTWTVGGTGDSPWNAGLPFANGNGVIFGDVGKSSHSA